MSWNRTEVLKNLNPYVFRAKYVPYDSMIKNRWDVDVSSYHPSAITVCSEREKEAIDIARKQMMENNHLRAKYEASRSIVKVIFNDPATIVIWKDGTKTIVKCQDGEPFDREKGLAMAISKKMLGNKGRYYDEFKKWIKEE